MENMSADHVQKPIGGLCAVLPEYKRVIKAKKQTAPRKAHGGLKQHGGLLMKKIFSFVTAAALAVPAMVTAPLSTVKADDNSYLLECSFENGENGFEGRGGAEVSTSSKAAYEGSGSLYCSGRSEAWQGAMISLGSNFVAGESYSFSVNVMYERGSASDTFHFTMQYNDDSGEAHYDKIDSKSVNKGEWTQLANKSFMIPANASDISVYIETDVSTGDFYIDELKIAENGTEIAGARFLLGDVNSDGVIDSLDMISARRLLLTEDKDPMLVKAADVDKSTAYELNDLVLLQSYILGSISQFPDNTPQVVAPPDDEFTSFEYSSNVQYREAPGNYFGSCAQEGKVVKESYNGINGQNNLNVYLPYGYDESKRYNIFYLMHGGGENENTLFYNDDTQIQHMFDHMIMNGEMEPMIVVTPTFNKTEAGNFYDELRRSVIPFVEGKYSTYANMDTSAESIAASRMHRAYGGFSMGAVSTWAVMQNCLDIVGYFMPLSGDHWQGNSSYDKAKSITDAIDRSGLKKNQYFVFAATGDDDIAYPNIGPQIEEMKKMSQFTYTSDFSQGNLYFLVASGKTHWWGYVRHYVYDALPYFFHESGK